MAYKLSLFFYLHYFQIVCKSQKRIRKVELANRQYSNNIRFKKDKNLLVLQSYILKCLRH